MQSLSKVAGTWVRQSLAWSNTRQAWEERAAFALLLVGVVTLFLKRQSLTLMEHLTWGGLLLVAVAVFARRGWVKLFGPVLFYDMLCIARRRRYFVLRVLFLGALLLMLCWIYFIWMMETRWRGGISSREMSTFAATFFYSFMGVQFSLVLLLTPAYVAGCIADEKDRKTLEFLLATDLRNHEIVLSKLGARVANLALLMLAGLPVLNGLQFLGGVDPELVAVGYVVTLVTMVSLASLSILNSVFAKKPRDGIVMTYLLLIGYLGLSGMSRILVVPLIPGGASRLSVADFVQPFPLDTLVDWFSAGNVGYGFYRVANSLRGGGIAHALPTVVGEYVTFHGLVILGCCVWAVARLRAIALKQTYGKPKKVRAGIRLVGRPPVGAWPMVWKELFAEPGFRFNWLARGMIAILFCLSFLPVGIILAEYYERQANPRAMAGFPAGWDAWYFVSREINGWIRICGTLLGMLMLLAVAVRAATALSGERDRQTFDGLQTTPLGSDSILAAKWLGSVLSVRWAWVWMGLMALIALGLTGMHPLAVPLLTAAWAAYALVYAGVGLWFSMTCRTSLRATIWTLLTLIGMSGGHWLLTGMFCYMPLALMRVSERDFEWMLYLQTGQTPPAVLGLFAFHRRDLDDFHRMSKDEVYFTTAALFGVLTWLGLAVALWFVNSHRCRLLMNLLPVQRGRMPLSAKPPGVTLPPVQTAHLGERIQLPEMK